MSLDASKIRKSKNHPKVLSQPFSSNMILEKNTKSQILSHQRISEDQPTSSQIYVNKSSLESIKQQLSNTFLKGRQMTNPTVSRPVMKDNYLTSSIIEDSLAPRRINMERLESSKVHIEGHANSKYNSAYSRDIKRSSGGNYGLEDNSNGASEKNQLESLNRRLDSMNKNSKIYSASGLENSRDQINSRVAAYHRNQVSNPKEISQNGQPQWWG